MYACLAVTCHLHFWQNDRDFLRATVVTRGWNGYRNKSQHRKSTLEKKILPPFQQGFEPATFQSRVRRSNHWAIPAPLIFGFSEVKAMIRRATHRRRWVTPGHRWAKIESVKPSISGFVLTSLFSAVGIENGHENMPSQAGHNSHDTALVRPKSRRISAGPGHDHCRGPWSCRSQPGKGHNEFSPGFFSAG